MDIRKRANLWRAVFSCMSVMLLQWMSPFVHADSSESLGPPSITIGAGTGIAAAGVGLSEAQPGVINVDVPAGATVNQVLLYWEGRHAFSPAEGDNTATVNGTEVTGEWIGGMDLRRSTSSAYRADITGLDVVNAGTSNLSIGDLGFLTNNGAGVVVIFADSSADPAAIDLRDGNDFAFYAYPDPQDTTVAQTFTFEATGEDRVATLMLFFSSVSGTASSGSALDFRPTAIEITLGDGTKTVFDNELDSKDGQEWDTVTVNVLIPAGETSVTVQALSVDNGADIPTGTNRDIPASFHWITGALAITPDLVPGRMTGGGKQVSIDHARVTRGFTIHCDIRLSNNIEVNWESNGESNRWHLYKPITSAVCSDDPAIEQKPPKAPIDTFEGEGSGRLNGIDGSIIRFVFVDAGEPGRNDTASIKIWAPGVDPDAAGAPPPVLDVSGKLDHGNIQAHYDQPHKQHKLFMRLKNK
jgi:hypothetical protein